jgi:hypothetical protein
MGFSLSGTTITQSGTDTVTSATTISGTTKSVANGRVTVFNFGGRTLVVNGTINLADGVAFHSYVMGSASTGTLNAGVEESNPSDYKYNYGVDMLSVSGTNDLNSGVTINIYGQSAYFNTNNFTISSSALQWKYARVHLDGRIDLTGAGYVVENSHIIITSAFPSSHFVRANAGSWIGNVIDAEDTNSYFALSTLTPAGTYNYSNISLLTGQNLVAYGSNFVSRILNLTNISSGTGYTLDSTTTSSIRNFTLQLNHSFDDTVQDSSFAAVEGAIVYLDGGTGTTASDTTDSSGVVSQSFRYQNNVVNSGSPSITSFISGNDITKTIVAYNYGISAQEVVDVRSSTGNSTTTTLSTDNLITETTKATTDAYTELETSAKFYDRAKAYLVDNYAGETATIVTRSGDTIDAGSYDVVVDATASTAFVFDGSTITIHADTFTGSITTSGTVTLLNGAVVNGTITDSTGTRTRATLTLTGLKENSEVRIYEAGTTTELAGIENSGTSFTYTYNHTVDFDVDIVIASLNFINIKLNNNTLTASNSSIPIQQQVDRNYDNP